MPFGKAVRARMPGGRIGPLEGSELDNDFVRFLLDGTSWAKSVEEK